MDVRVVDKASHYVNLSASFKAVIATPNIISTDYLLCLSQPYEGLLLQTSHKQAKPHLPGGDPGVCLPDKLPGGGMRVFLCVT